MLVSKTQLIKQKRKLFLLGTSTTLYKVSKILPISPPPPSLIQGNVLVILQMTFTTNYKVKMTKTTVIYYYISNLLSVIPRICLFPLCFFYLFISSFCNSNYLKSSQYYIYNIKSTAFTYYSMHQQIKPVPYASIFPNKIGSQRVKHLRCNNSFRKTKKKKTKKWVMNRRLTPETKLPQLTKGIEERVNSLDAPVPRRKHRSEPSSIPAEPFHGGTKTFFRFNERVPSRIDGNLLYGPVSSASSQTNTSPGQY